MSLTVWLLCLGLAHGHQGHTRTLAWDACDHSEVGETCTYDVSDQERHIGTCRSMSGDLLCVRNRPVVDPTRASSTDLLWIPLVAGVLLLPLGAIRLRAFLRATQAPSR